MLETLETVVADVGDEAHVRPPLRRRAVLRISGDLTVSWTDGRVETVAERVAGSSGKAYWGASHELLIADFYRTLPDPEPFWISPAEATRVLRLVEKTYEEGAA